MVRLLSVRFIITLTILFALSLVFYANTALGASSRNILLSEKGKSEQLQVGEEWSRVHFDGRLTTTEALNKAIIATARIDIAPLTGSSASQRGTSFYIGKFGEYHLMLTNYHVMSTREQCAKAAAIFQYSGKRYKCRKIIKSFPEMEATFFAIHVPDKNDAELSGKELRFDFLNEYKPGHKIVVAGHGTHNNSSNRLTYENSSTCIVATTTYQSVQLSIKSKNDNKVYSAFSFAHACEISHGDSGAALVSESTQKVIGLNWATSTAKHPDLLRSSTLFDWIESNDFRIWNSLSYGVSTTNISSAIYKSGDPTLIAFVQSNVANNLH